MLSPALALQWRATQEAGPAPAADAPRAPATRSAALPPVTDDQHVPIVGETSFGEFLSALNPLQHLPVVGTIYRAITGDTVQPAYRVLGGLLLGGPIGAVTSAVGAAVEALWQDRGANDTAPAPPTAVAIAAASRPDPGALASMSRPGSPPAPAPAQASASADTTRAADAEDRLRRLRAATTSYARDVQAPLLALAQSRGLAEAPTAGRPGM
jgi:hypothetical protein